MMPNREWNHRPNSGQGSIATSDAWRSPTSALTSMAMLVSAMITACALIDHLPRHVEYAHDDVAGVRDDEHSRIGFENPLEEQEGVNVVQVVAVGQHLDQLLGT